jgi:hypothetical protein
MGGARKIAAALLAATFCAAMLAACGGGDSSTATTSGGQAQQPPEPATPGGNTGGGSGQSQGGGSGEGSSQGGSESGGGSESSGNERSSSFRTPGGDNSIQEYGDEAGAEERAKATKTIATFYSATAGEEWPKVCAILSAKNVKAMELFAKRIPKVKTQDCPGVLAVVNTNAQANPPEAIKGDVVSLRVEGDVAFALYHGRDGKNYAFPVTLEGGEWKLTSLAPTPLSF